LVVVLLGFGGNEGSDLFFNVFSQLLKIVPVVKQFLALLNL
jgi:hypothetical protein